MNEEEKEAMKYFYNLRATIDESNMLFDEDINVKCGKETIEKITTILNLIKKQQAEIETLKRDFEIVDHECSRLEQEDIKKDRLINLMAEQLATPVHSKEWVIDYYKREIEK